MNKKSHHFTQVGRAAGKLILLVLMVGGFYVQAGEGNALESPEKNPGKNGMASSLLGIFDKYQQLQPALKDLDLSVFMNAYLGYLNLQASGQTHSSILTIVDLKKPSSSPRMWILDLEKDSLLLQTWAAHGKGSGRERAESFSNIPGSLQSSLGFYLTAEEYRGKNGRSLRLDGMDEGFNSNARSRHVVMHGADYVSMDTLSAYGFMGNSEGCPAVSHEVNHQVIDWVKNRSVLFISGEMDGYRSKWIDAQLFFHGFRYYDTP